MGKLLDAIGALMLSADSKPLWNLIAETILQDDCLDLFDSLFAAMGASVVCGACTVTFSNHPPATWMADILATASCAVEGGPAGTFYAAKKRSSYLLSLLDFNYLFALFDLTGRFSGTVRLGAVAALPGFWCESLVEANDVRQLGSATATAGEIRPVARFDPIPNVFSSTTSGNGRTFGSGTPQPTCTDTNGVECTFVSRSGEGFDTTFLWDCNGSPLSLNAYLLN